MPAASASGHAASGQTPPQFARGPVLTAMATLAVVLTVVSNRYGYHRDELYFRMLRPAWGYVDQPPLTPLLARLFGAIADQAWAIRIPATMATVLSVLVMALVTREMGGGRAAQGLCAWAYAFASLPLILGHVLLTATIDMAVWPAVALFTLRAQLRRDPRWWLAVGAVVGVSTYNKLLVAVLLLALAGGVLLVGPRSLLWSPWVLGSAALALVVATPNLAYQATHSWPQLSMGRALARNNAADVHVSMWPFLFLLLGPPLVPFWVSGLVAMARRPEWRPVRFVAAAFPVLLVLVYLMGSQVYYPFGLVAVLFAVGCVPVERWAAGLRWRRRLVGLAAALNALVSLVLGLPLIPLASVGATPVPGVNQIAQDSIGWRAYVRQVAEVVDTLPPAEHARAVIVASNYGEAGALDRYGPSSHLPRVYSGQNDLYFQARPPASADVAVVVGGQVTRARGLFASCSAAGRLDNGVDVDNEEQGEPIAVCRTPVGGWAAVWPALRHED